MMRWRVTVALALALQSCATPVSNTPSAPPAASARHAARETVILVSEDIPAYTQVAAALARQLGRHARIHSMSDASADTGKMLDEYKEDAQHQFVSIGLDASVAAKALPKRLAVFCQVFNYQDYQLVTATHKGVSMMPSIPKTFEVWHAIAPGTTDVGIVSGPGLEDMIQSAREAAKRLGITLHHEVVKTDKEYQYAFKHMADEVQGYWLLPDNRVLSRTVLRDVMAFSVHNGKQVAVFNDELLGLGGLFSTTSDYHDIAQHVLERLKQAQNQETLPGPDILYPDKLVLRINRVMAQRLNLAIPAQYGKHEQVL